MPNYLVTDTLTGHARIVTLDEAAHIAQLAEAEIEQALEEFGVCETVQHTICDISDADVFDLTKFTGPIGAEA